MQRCNAGFRLEKLAHETAVGKFQAVCNLRDGQVRVTQQYLYLHNHGIVYDAFNRLAAGLFDGQAQIVIADAQFVGEPADSPFRTFRLREECNEFGAQFVSATA